MAEPVCLQPPHHRIAHFLRRPRFVLCGRHKLHRAIDLFHRNRRALHRRLVAHDGFEGTAQVADQQVRRRAPGHRHERQRLVVEGEAGRGHRIGQRREHRAAGHDRHHRPDVRIAAGQQQCEFGATGTADHRDAAPIHARILRRFHDRRMHAVQRNAVEVLRRVRRAEIAEREQRVAPVEEALALPHPAFAGPGVAALAAAETDQQGMLAAFAREQFHIHLPMPRGQGLGIEALDHPPHVRGQQQRQHDHDAQRPFDETPALARCLAHSGLLQWNTSSMRTPSASAMRKPSSSDGA